MKQGYKIVDSDIHLFEPVGLWADYLDPGLCRKVYEALLEFARPGARFVYWNMLAPRSRPTSLAGVLEAVASDDGGPTDLGERLLLEDKAFFYNRFRTSHEGCRGSLYRRRHTSPER